jgi:hypothetical protein
VSEENQLHRIDELRARRWSDVPDGPGVYWWYFPQPSLDGFQITERYGADDLCLRRAAEYKVCLYHGMAKSLRQRIVWHSEQELTLSALRSGFLSTFRFTLLALNGYDYSAGAKEIDRFIDQLSISWKLTTTAIEAKSAEAKEIGGRFLYPLNLQGNHRPELVRFHQHLTSMRAAYKLRHLKLAE